MGAVMAHQWLPCTKGEEPFLLARGLVALELHSADLPLVSLPKWLGLCCQLPVSLRCWKCCCWDRLISLFCLLFPQLSKSFSRTLPLPLQGLSPIRTAPLSACLSAPWLRGVRAQWHSPPLCTHAHFYITLSATEGKVACQTP